MLYMHFEQAAFVQFHYIIIVVIACIVQFSLYYVQAHRYSTEESDKN